MEVMRRCCGWYCEWRGWCWYFAIIIILIVGGGGVAFAVMFTVDGSVICVNASIE